MDDLGAAVSIFLAQPGAMEQLEAVAKQLGLGGSSEPPTQKENKPEPWGEISPERLQGLITALQHGTAENATALLEAMTPLLGQDKREKLRRAAKALRLMGAAKAVAGTIEL